MDGETTNLTEKKAKAKGKKKAKAKKTNGDAVRKSTAYAPSAKLTDQAIEELGNQAKVIADAVIKHAPATLAQLADAVANKLTTKQDPKRVVAFYLTQFKNDGLIKKAA